MGITVLTAISGTDIQQCIANLRTYAASAGKGEVDYLCLEDEIVAASSQLLKKLGYPEDSFPHVLSLPWKELNDICRMAFECLLQKVKSQGCTTVMSLHPVLYHQETEEYLQPYSVLEMKSALEASSVELNRIVSIHDDIYDVYRRLLDNSQKLFHPSHTRPEVYDKDQDRYTLKRQPEIDLKEIRQLLDWRDRELSSSRSLASGLNTEHLLMHRKTRIKTFWETAFENKAHVYFSHPIAQPRRDITNAYDNIKNPKPDPERGRKFIESCQEAADLLGGFVPLVEPTAIDELRLKEMSALEGQENQLARHILPPLTPRWPIGADRRLGHPISHREFGEMLLPVDTDVFAGRESDRIAPKEYKIAMQLLKEEMRRQINVRDHVLASQARLIFVYRPYSSPYRAELSGGVSAEIEMLSNRLKLNEDVCKPALIVYHPVEDEKRRREIEFESLFDQYASKHFSEGDELTKFKDVCLQIVLGTDNIVHPEKVAALVNNEIDKRALKPTSGSVSSAMPKKGLRKKADARESFCTEFLEETTVLKSGLHSWAESANGLVEFVGDAELNIRLANRIVIMIEGE